MNHFPGSWLLGRKDHLCRNITAMARTFPAEYDIAPKTYLLPADAKLLEREFEERKANMPAGRGPVYIRKPPANAEGRGIHLVTDLKQLSRRCKHVVQVRVCARPLTRTRSLARLLARN